MPKVKVSVNGQLVEAESMPFTPEAEAWSYYRLQDGTRLKLKSVVTDITKLPTIDPVTGLPQYMVRASNVVAVEPTPVTKDDAH